MFVATSEPIHPLAIVVCGSTSGAPLKPPRSMVVVVRRFSFTYASTRVAAMGGKGP